VAYQPNYPPKYNSKTNTRHQTARKQEMAVLEGVCERYRTVVASANIEPETSGGGGQFGNIFTDRKVGGAGSHGRHKMHVDEMKIYQIWEKFWGR
jgi:hypothetical protein